MFCKINQEIVGILGIIRLFKLHLQVPMVCNQCWPSCQVDSPKADTISKIAHDAQPNKNLREGMFL